MDREEFRQMLRDNLSIEIERPQFRSAVKISLVLRPVHFTDDAEVLEHIEIDLKEFLEQVYD